jgi:hypothetical protein
LGTAGNLTGVSSETVQSNGGIYIELIVDSLSNPVSTVDAWTASYALNCSVMHDKDGASRPALANGGDREWSYLVDLSNMQIVWTAFGSLGGGLPIEDYAGVLALVEMCKPQYLDCP